MGRTVYGINPVFEALKAKKCTISSISVSLTMERKNAERLLQEAARRGIHTERVSNDSLDALTHGARHQGVVALLAGEFEYKDIEDAVAAWKASGEKAFFLILDSIQDPQNLGAFVRSACAAGVHAIIIPKDRSAEVTPAVVKASAGAVEHALVARVTNLATALRRLKEENVWITGIEADGTTSIHDCDFKGDVAIVVGSEGAGIRRLVKEECDYLAFIPMKGEVNSLNAAQAGTVALFEVVRQRR